MSKELRVNPGGTLSPRQVVGRDVLIAEVWRCLEQRSVLLTSERRMGKTSVMSKMAHEAPPGTNAVKTSLQGVQTPEELVRRLIAEIGREMPGVLTRSFVKRLRKSGLRKVAAKPFEVEFEPVGEDAWKDVLTEALEAVDAGLDERPVFLWDEVPHMVMAVATKRDVATARDVLDVLKFARETYISIRMVFSGSIGMHHVIPALREPGVNWMPTHDMAVVDVPPLADDDAVYLASELLANEGLACKDAGAVAEAIAAEVDRVPHYVHHTVDQLLNGQRVDDDVVSVGRVREVVERAIADPLDPWQLRHYVDRVPAYYPRHNAAAYAVLDVVAVGAGESSFEEIARLVAAQIPPPDDGELHALIELLCRDYYIESSRPGYRFRLELVRRAWIARRPRR